MRVALKLLSASILATTALVLIIYMIPGWRADDLRSRHPSTKNTNDTFYIWQRNWSETVSKAVLDEPASTRFYFLSREMNDGIAARTSPDWNSFKALENSPIPVFRIHYSKNWLKKNPTTMEKVLQSEIESVQKEFATQNIKLQEIQLDLDCPERLLDKYCEFLRKIKSSQPDLKFSITALPCHLGRKSFYELASVADEYVLQIHGLDVPKNISEKAQIMNFKTASDAIDRAERLGRRFRVAIPSYGYEILFDAKNGKFARISAENIVSRTDNLRSKFSVPDLKELCEIRKKALKSPNCIGVIWFRLPVIGDRLCLDRTTISEIQNGQIPEPSIGAEINVSAEDKDLREIIVSNKGVIGVENAVLEISSDEDIYCDYGLYPTAKTLSEIHLPGLLPQKILFNVPEPGTNSKIAWIRGLRSNPKITVTAQDTK